MLEDSQNKTTPAPTTMDSSLLLAELNNVLCISKYLICINEPIVNEKFGESAAYGFCQITSDLTSRIENLITAVKSTPN